MQADERIIAGEARLPGLAHVLDAGRTQALLVRAGLCPADAPVSIDYVKYKPGASCLTGVSFQASGGRQRLSIRAWSPSGDKWPRASQGPAVVLDTALAITARVFPDDAEVRGPSRLGTERAIDRLGLHGAELRLLVYKPERRAVYRMDRDGVSVGVVKCHDRSSFGRARLAHEALAAVPDTPAPGAFRIDERRRTLVHPWVAGTSVTTDVSPLREFRAAGAWLARLHGNRIALPETVPDDSLLRLVGDVSHLLPDLAPSLQRLHQRIRQCDARGTSPRAPIHGDFYVKQLLSTPSGIACIDFDEARIDDPHVDVALFIAHLERDVAQGTVSRDRADEVCRAFVDAYANGADLRDDRLEWRTAEALLRLAPHPFRHRHPHWPDLTRAIVARASDLLAKSERRRTERQRALLHGDTQLRGIADMLEAERAAPELGVSADDLTVELVRRKPQRRCILEFTIGGAEPVHLLGKVRAKGIDREAERIHRELWAHGVRCIAEPMGVIPARRMTLQRFVNGASVAQRLRDGHDPVELAEGVARSLRTLHLAPVIAARSWPVDRELEMLRERLRTLGQTHPEWRDDLLRLSTRLELLSAPLRTAPAPVLLHRDLYQDQIIWSGGRAVLIDLDLAARGDAALDLGNCIAHVLEWSWRDAAVRTTGPCFAFALLESYLRVASDVSADHVLRYTLLSLARLVQIATERADRRDTAGGLLRRVLDATSAGETPDLARLTEGIVCHAA